MIKAVKDLLFPPRCAFCKGLLQPDQEFLCSVCAKSTRELGKSTAVKGHFFNGAMAVYHYSGGPRRAILAYKFRSRTCLSEFFGIKMAQRAQSCGKEFDLVTAVPSHRNRVRKNGFDHAYMLAHETAKRLSLPCSHTLRRTRHTKPMHGLTPSQRRANVMGSIDVIHSENVEGKRILLCDDILTTGSTASECARMLKGAGAKEVWVLAATAKK